MCKICSKLTSKKRVNVNSDRSGAFITNFENIQEIISGYS